MGDDETLDFSRVVIALPSKRDLPVALAKECWAIYSAFREAGFSEEQSFSLLMWASDVGES